MATRRQHGEGSLYHRKDRGQWVAVADLGYRGKKRDRREFTGPTPEIALERRARFLDNRRGGFVMPKGRPPTVAEWCLHWLYNIARAKVEPTTWHGSYRSKVEGLIVPFFQRVRLPDLSEEDVERWHRHLERHTSAKTGQALSASTVAQAHRIFSTAVKAAVVRGKLPRNPCSNVAPPRVVRDEPQPPSAAEVELILDRCASWPNGARWVVAITTGIRQGEALALRWRDVRLADPASLSVSQSAARVKGERVVKAPKSAKGRRDIPLLPEAVEALRAHRGEVVDISGLVFTRKGKPWHPRADWQDWQNLLAELGLPHYRVHDLRHATATMMLERGVDVRVVQEILGHATAAFTQQAYQHVRPALKQSAVDALARAMRGE